MDMMAINFSISGIGLGIAIPAISNRIVFYKEQKRNLKTDVQNLDKKVYGFLAVLNGLLWIYAGMMLDNTFIAILTAMISTVAILIAAIDMRIRLIPNELVLLMLCLGMLFQIILFGWVALLYACFSMAAIGLVFVIVGRLLGFEQVGAGDVKLSAAIGLVLGYPHIKIALIGMSAALLVFCLGGLAVKKLNMQSTFPFAPFMMFGTVCALINIIGEI